MHENGGASTSEVEQSFLALLDALLSPTGLPAFVCGPGASRVRAGALNLTGSLVVLGGDLALPYVAGVRRACLTLLRIDQPADVATATLGVLDRLCEAHVPADVLRPAELLRELQAAKGRSGGQYSKKGARPRGALFRSLGLLLHAYAAVFDEQARGGGLRVVLWETTCDMPRPPAPQSAWDALDALVAAVIAEWGTGGGAGETQQQQAERERERARSNPVVDGCLRGLFHLFKAHPNVLVSPRVSARHFSSKRTLKQGGFVRL